MSDERRIIEGLVGEKHRVLWQRSAVFHANVTLLSRMLPLWIDALAEQAQDAEERFQTEIARIMNTPLSSLTQSGTDSPSSPKASR